MVPHHHHQEIARSIPTPPVVKYQITPPTTCFSRPRSQPPPVHDNSTRLPDQNSDFAVSFYKAKPLRSIHTSTCASSPSSPPSSPWPSQARQNALHPARGAAKNTRKFWASRFASIAANAMTSGSAEFRRNHTASPLEVTGYCDDIGVCQVDQ
ncbi:unnamed protein product [Zymoseptoria tritici ST99CH_3D7]|uniref:Uncharacterized protein n=1 Tax=Zymoseptoria tritici (strain ST99CH_3D7) TaxID=1276538 RepID=A0A1X7RYT1_ZYMT9|nr:unnamed protein product [Zymoseptoria tritici ST99CH_3D7]